MIKYKVSDIKVILKTYFKNIKNKFKNFQVANRFLFYKSSYNYFQKLFLKIVFKVYLVIVLKNSPKK